MAINKYNSLDFFCGHHLLVSKLRSSNVDPAAGALEELQRVVKLIKEKWKETEIIVRGDSAYCPFAHFREGKGIKSYRALYASCKWSPVVSTGKVSVDEGQKAS